MFDIFVRTDAMTLSSLFNLILVTALYFIKGKNDKVTSKIFEFSIYLTFLLTVIFSLWAWFATIGSEYRIITGRIVLLGFICWDLILLFYMTFVLRDGEKNKEFFKKNKTGLIVGAIIVFLINVVLVFVLGVDTYQTDIRLTHHLKGGLAIYEQILRNIVLVYAVVILFVYKKKTDVLTKVLFCVLLVVCAIQYIHVLVGPFKLNDDILINVMTIFFLYLSIESQDKLLIAEYNDSIKKTRDFNELKSNFMKNISHQIRTPMSVIVGMGEHILINENLSEEEIRESTSYVKDASDSLLNLANSIFDLSRIESGKEIVNEENYYLDNVIFDISSNINSKLKENITFTINADEICPNDLVGDGHKVCKILNTFLTNAINHTEYGEVSLNIGCIQVDSLNYELTFLIKNSGHNMTDKMFSLNYEDIVKMSDINYNIINLVVAKNLLEMIGGNVEFINETGKGTQYIIKLKQKLSGQNRLGNIKEKIQTNYDLSHRIINLIGKSVLIVDKEKANIELLSKYLAQYNLKIDTSFEISDANNLINTNNYDLIFINNKIEGLNLSNKSIKVIGLFDMTDESSKDNYFGKLYYPLQFKDLNKIINDIYKDVEVK